ncbi:hypothetical protein SUGI_0900180 [Cryptomeria japonica]|nr:hypothetical protein SUGI_0900180 [Cryptomeria japonica]
MHRSGWKCVDFLWLALTAENVHSRMHYNRTDYSCFAGDCIKEFIYYPLSFKDNLVGKTYDLQLANDKKISEPKHLETKR